MLCVGTFSAGRPGRLVSYALLSLISLKKVSSLLKRSCQVALSCLAWQAQLGASPLPPNSAAALCPHRRTHRQRSANARLAVAAAAQTKPLTAEAAAAAASLDSWRQSRALLEQRLGFAAEEADKVVSDAFGWGPQAYWRQQKVQEPPSETQVQQVRCQPSGEGGPSCWTGWAAGVGACWRRDLGCECCRGRQHIRPSLGLIELA
jgi:hypothetical protein